jgi:hypothetical protein
MWNYCFSAGFVYVAGKGLLCYYKAYGEVNVESCINTIKSILRESDVVFIKSCDRPKLYLGKISLYVYPCSDCDDEY